MKVVFIRQGHNQRAAALPLTASEGEWHKNTCRRPTPPETEPGRNSNPYGSTVLENRHFYLKKNNSKNTTVFTSFLQGQLNHRQNLSHLVCEWFKYQRP